MSPVTSIARPTREQLQFTKATLGEQVRRAQPLAIERVLRHGIEGPAGDVVAELEQLLGAPNYADPIETYVTHTSAAFAFGLSMGLLLPADFFNPSLRELMRVVR